MGSVGAERIERSETVTPRLGPEKHTAAQTTNPGLGNKKLPLARELGVDPKPIRA